MALLDAWALAQGLSQGGGIDQGVRQGAAPWAVRPATGYSGNPGKSRPPYAGEK